MADTLRALPAASIGSRAILCVLVLIAQALTLFPGWVLFALVMMASLGAVGGDAVIVAWALIIIPIYLILMYALIFAAVLIAGRIISRPTFFSAKHIATRATLVVGAWLIFIPVSAVLLGPWLPNANSMLADIIIGVVDVLIIVSCIATTWTASRRHIDSL